MSHRGEALLSTTSPGHEDGVADARHREGSRGKKQSDPQVAFWGRFFGAWRARKAGDTEGRVTALCGIHGDKSDGTGEGVYSKVAAQGWAEGHL